LENFDAMRFIVGIFTSFSPEIEFLPSRFFIKLLIFSISYGILLLVNKLTKRRTNVFTY